MHEIEWLTGQRPNNPSQSSANDGRAWRHQRGTVAIPALVVGWEISSGYIISYDLHLTLFWLGGGVKLPTLRENEKFEKLARAEGGNRKL